MDIHQQLDAGGEAGEAVRRSSKGLATCPSPDQRQKEGDSSVPRASSKAGLILILNLSFAAFSNSQAQGGE